jgi:3-methylfumaryl-CoA hydratase
VISQAPVAVTSEQFMTFGWRIVTLLMTELPRTELGGRLTAITSKHVAPLFCGRPILLGADPQDGKWLLRAFDGDGRLAVDIHAEENGDSH